MRRNIFRHTSSSSKFISVIIPKRHSKVCKQSPFRMSFPPTSKLPTHFMCDTNPFWSKGDVVKIQGHGTIPLAFAIIAPPMHALLRLLDQVTAESPAASIERCLVTSFKLQNFYESISSLEMTPNCKKYGRVGWLLANHMAA